jgi:branched-chain amino acid aminotransferase
MAEPRFLTHVLMDGEPIPRSAAKVGVATPAFRYGAMVFEGLRVYLDGEGRPHCFRPGPHLDRLTGSLRIVHFDADPSTTDLRWLLAGLRALEVDRDAHVRLMVYLSGDGPMWETAPVSSVLMASPVSSALPDGASRTAIVTGWRRLSDGALPPRVKSAANYQNSRLGALEARERGVDVAIFLDDRGKLTESQGACVFLVRHGQVVTPPVTSGILESITRASVIELLRDAGHQVVEREVDRTELYTCSEAFICGSMAEVAPLTRVDRHALAVGPVTRQAGRLYEDAVRGRHEVSERWCVPL